MPAGEIQAVPGEVRILDNGVPWIRTQRELLEEWTAVDEISATFLAGGRHWSDLDGVELYVAGMWASARWTLGIDPDAPVTSKPRAVTGAAIRKELSWAEMCVASRLDGWECTTGTLNWLLWITGGREDMLWPDRFAAQATARRRTIT
ncbi:hypothetical protein LWF15_13950 [Kineosporia rhizophila]|uniref:hypothetical protein n=1 Tax=Kineosporia rhizophila TaxID=84633 RepID=UPI001E5B2C34|nr:hypothetical protein [Kineosporia rhizophila]MCE0536611.1 hypothetical protein [Kineosporia rhizophila]